MSKNVLFIGARRSGKTHRAIEEARRVSPRVMVIAPTRARAASISQQYLVFATHRYGIPANRPDAIAIEHVEKMQLKKVLAAIGTAIDQDAPIWATANPPRTERAQKVIDVLLAAGFQRVDCDESAQPSAKDAEQ